jgi:hypothetical protein
MSVPDDVTYQIVSFVHGTTELSAPVASTLHDVISFLAIKYGASVWAQKRVIIDRVIEAEITVYGYAEDISAGARATLAITLKQADGTNAVLSITNMLRGTATRNQGAPPYSRSVNFIPDGTPVLTITL